MLKELTDDSKIIREEIKVTVNEIKKSPQGTNSGENEAKNHINDLKQRKEKAFNQNSRKKNIFKDEDKLRNLWDICKRTNI